MSREQVEKLLEEVEAYCSQATPGPEVLYLDDGSTLYLRQPKTVICDTCDNEVSTWQHKETFNRCLSCIVKTHGHCSHKPEHDRIDPYTKRHYCGLCGARSQEHSHDRIATLERHCARLVALLREQMEREHSRYRALAQALRQWESYSDEQREDREQLRESNDAEALMFQGFEKLREAWWKSLLPVPPEVTK